MIVGHPGRQPALRLCRRRGFTLVELAIVVMVVALLAAVAVPNFQRALLRARAADAVSELHLIRVALMQYVGDRHAWPRDVARGQTPRGLEPYLPEGFDFGPPDYTIDYDNWAGKKQGFVGLTVITKDEALGAAIVDFLGSNAWTDGKKRFTWVIEWSE